MNRDTFEYNGKTWQIIKNDSISPYNHCIYCDFNSLCDSYVDSVLWFACGCTCKAGQFYIKEIINN